MDQFSVVLNKHEKEIKNITLPCTKNPCKDCPFRKDSIKGWLGKQRMTEIIQANSFVCHKKTNLQCAGHMLLNGEQNEFVQLAKRLGLETGIKGRELVFDNKNDCIEHHGEI